jgi:hypothetical protein
MAIPDPVVIAAPPAEHRGRSSLAFRALYRVLGWMDPLLLAWWRRFGLGNVVLVTTTGRRTRRPRGILLGLLATDGRWYLGHPDGPAAWTRNLDADQGRLLVRWPGLQDAPFLARLLPVGPERERAILATWQHPFPGDLIYRLARRHVLAVGRYYRLERDEAAA